MNAQLTDRKGLASVLLGNGDEIISRTNPTDLFPEEQVVGENVCLIWDRTDRGELPAIIVVADGNLRDFLAWASTYFPQYRPFTAYFRVLESNTLKQLKNWNESPSFRGFEAACVGLMLGEAQSLTSDQKTRAQLTVIACSSTLSYCLARALALGAEGKTLEFVCEQWQTARRITDQPLRPLDDNKILEVWHVLGALKNKSDIEIFTNKVPAIIIEACSQLKHTGEIEEYTWFGLTNGSQDLKSIKAEMTGPREDRVRAFQRIVSNESLVNLNDHRLQGFIIGYLASLIGPGSMSHAGILTQLVSQFSSILLWYGLCAGLHKRNELLSSFNVLGRRLIRELLVDELLFSFPSADIALSELEILSSGSTKRPDFRSFSSSYIVVELVPSVNTFLTWIKRDTEHRLLLPEMYSYTDIFSRLQFVLEEALELHRKLSATGGDSTYGQRNVEKFEQRRRKVRKARQ